MEGDAWDWFVTSTL
jgi:hypothetical protein